MTDPLFAEIDLTDYRPATLADQPAPELRWVAIDRLVIDRSYQRDITPAGHRAIQRIADGFDWRLFGALQCAPLDDGRFAIVDGQHRAHGAALAGVTAVPAMIVPMPGADQARGFAAMNRDRIKVDALSVYRAELAAGSDWALAVRDAVSAAGCVMMWAKYNHASKRTGQIFSIALVRRMVADGEAAAVTVGLSAIRQSVQGERAEAYNGKWLAVWLPAVARNQQFLRLDLSRIFDGIDFEGELDAARLRARVTGGSANAIAIDAVLATLRAHLRGVVA